MGPADGPLGAVARQARRDGRARTVAFACVFGIYTWLQAAGYRSAYPTPADRIGFARSFGGNAAIRLFYGYPYDITSVAGYTAWRVGGTLAVAAAAYGLLAGVRSLRADEDAGRTELVLAGVVGRRRALAATLTGVGAGVAVLGLA